MEMIFKFLPKVCQSAAEVYLSRCSVPWGGGVAGNALLTTGHIFGSIFHRRSHRDRMCWGTETVCKVGKSNFGYSTTIIQVNLDALPTEKKISCFLRCSPKILWSQKAMILHAKLMKAIHNLS